MGRRPDPLPLKILKGRSETKDIAGRPIPQAPAFNRGAPDPPGWLNPEARGEWNRIAPELDRLELIKPEDAGILVAYCLAWSRLVSAEAIIQTEGLTAMNPQTGRRAVHPAVYVVQAASRDLLRLGSHFGLTPVSEVNLATPAKPDSDDDANPFAGA